jgi:hypothetical protein
LIGDLNDLFYCAVEIGTDTLKNILGALDREWVLLGVIGSTLCSKDKEPTKRLPLIDLEDIPTGIVLDLILPGFCSLVCVSDCLCVIQLSSHDNPSSLLKFRELITISAYP